MRSDSFIEGYKLWVFISLGAFTQISNEPTLYSQHSALSISSVVGSDHCPKFGVEQLVIEAAGEFNNPFDPDQVKLEARVTGPDGTVQTVPGFFNQDFSRTGSTGSESVQPMGHPEWVLRICPTLIGHYKVTVEFRDHTGATSKEFGFDSTESNSSGFIRPSSRDSHYFEFSDGSGFFPTGVDLFTTGPVATSAYDGWLKGLSGSGVNLTRLLLNSSQSSFAIERPGKPADGLGAGLFNLESAWKLDQVLETARLQNIYSILCLDQAGELSIRDNNPDWTHNPLSQDNGGPLRVWTDFWSSSAGAKIYRNKLRYLVARYGADTHLFAWELWKNADQIQEYDAGTLRNWLSRVVPDLHSMDPYNHMVSLGFAAPNQDRDTYLLRGIDFTEMQLFGAKPVGELADQLQRRTEWGKPTIVTESAVDRMAPHLIDDPDAAQFHDPLWISLTSSSAGSAMPWWGSEYADSPGFAGLMRAFTKFIAGIDFSKEGFRYSESELTFDQKGSMPNGDLILDQGPMSWTPGVGNRPQTLNIYGERALGPSPSRILHGTKASPELHNPLTVNIREGCDSKLVLDVSRISHKLGARLEVTVDGEKQLVQPFLPKAPGPNADFDFAFQGRFEVPLAKGAHQVIVENTGDDWMQLEYRVAGIIPLKAPPANIWTLSGNKTVIAWIQQKGVNWQSTVGEKHPAPVIPACNLSLQDLASGTWDVEVYDTWKGQSLTKSTVSVGLDGKASLSVPSFTSDVAVKLTKRT